MDIKSRFDEGRITSLDGLRGLAIFLVVMFHAYARWPEYLPWTTVHKEFLFFKYGWLGVELFFLISGFVICLTLDRCKTFFEFIVRRWLRLFPAMLIATLLVYATAFLLPERPNGLPNYLDVLPGLFFVEPDILRRLGIHSIAIEGAFWSLFVEVKFYFIFGAFYFLNKNKAIYLLISLFLLSFFYHVAMHFYPPIAVRWISTLFGILSIQYFGWFALGALLYQAYARNSSKYLAISLFLLGPVCMGMEGRTWGISAFCLGLYLIFVAALLNRRVARIFSSRIPVFIGFISYPLYLIHENAMVAMTIKTHANYQGIPSMLTPLPGILCILLMAFLIAKYGEPFVRNNIKAWIVRPLKRPQDAPAA